MVLNILENYRNRILVSHSYQTHPSENGHYGACRELHPQLQCAPSQQTEGGLGYVPSEASGARGSTSPVSLLSVRLVPPVCSPLSCPTEAAIEDALMRLS